MSKRDDDSQSDMEVGMTTAERRRRRRRGGGLRVPSDNVPRRSTTPPGGASVPEDPSLAMSIAYSVTAESSEPILQAAHDAPAPSFDNHEAMPTVIDSVSGPVEQADFEMKTREMTAVDFEALGLTGAGASGNPLPVERIASPRIARTPPPTEPSGSELGGSKHDDTDPVDDVDVEFDGGTEGSAEAVTEGVAGAGATLAQEQDAEPDEEPDEDAEPAEPEEDATTDLAEMDNTELSALGPSEPSLAGESASAAASPMTPPAIAYKAARARTVALSEDDLEEVRESARVATQPPLRSGGTSTSTSMPPPTPSAKPAEAKPSPAKPSSIPEIDIMALDDKAAESSGEFEVDVEGVDGGDGVGETQPALAAPPSAPAVSPEPRTRQSSPPAGHSHPLSTTTSNSPQTTPAREAQPTSIARDAQHASPPPRPVSHKAPPSPPPAKKDKAPAPAIATADGKPGRGKAWFVDLFDEDYLRTLPFLTPQATQAEAEFAIHAMGLSPGAQVLDIGCGYGRHAMELAARGFHVVGLDMSAPLLMRGGEEAHRRGLTINFVRGDMRELDFEAQFDGAYCLFSTFGYFDDETNKKTVSNIARSLKPGGRVLIEILNRDYVIADLPTRVWWEGEGCVVLEEVDLNYFSSRIQVNRSVVFDDGRQLEQEISVRAYSLHEVGKLLHAAGLRVLEVSGAYHTRGRFFGNQSRHIIVLAERKDPSVT